MSEQCLCWPDSCLYLSHIRKASSKRHTSHVCHDENTQKDLVVAVAYCGALAMHLPNYPEDIILLKNDFYQRQFLNCIPLTCFLMFFNTYVLEALCLPRFVVDDLVLRISYLQVATMEWNCIQIQN